MQIFGGFYFLSPERNWVQVTLISVSLLASLNKNCLISLPHMNLFIAIPLASQLKNRPHTKKKRKQNALLVNALAIWKNATFF